MKLIITGGTGKLGKAIHAEFEQHGWEVEALSRNQLDVRNRNALTLFFKNLELDLLVCAAGVSEDKLLLKCDAAAWEAHMRTNFFGAKDCAELVFEQMKYKGAGHIIFLSSYTAFHPQMGQSLYATSKAMLCGLMEDLAPEFGFSGIRVNTILPGFIESKMTMNISENTRKKVLSDQSLSVMSNANQVAKFIRFLHEELPAVSNQVFQLDSRKHL